MALPMLNPSGWEADEGWFSRERMLALVLLLATGLAFYLCYLLTVPFLPALAWAVALAVVARPLHDWIAARVRNADVAALLAVVVVVVILLVPTVFVARQLVREVAAGVELVEDGAQTERWRRAVEGVPWLGPTLTWLGGRIDVPGEVNRALPELTGRLTGLVGGSVWVAVQLLVTLFILFYFLRDRRQALRAVRSVLPLSDAEVDKVFHRVGDTIHATVYGRLLTALVQGALGGLMFWLLGLPAPVLWGVVMALLSVVPYLGSFVVWAPAAAFLLLEGSWGRALILTAWGAVVIGLSDNLLYPILVGGRLRMHTVPAFIAILGGLAAFGVAGLIVGPVIVAVTFALVAVWRHRTADGRTAETGVTHPEPAVKDGPPPPGRAAPPPTAAAAVRTEGATGRDRS